MMRENRDEIIVYKGHIQHLYYFMFLSHLFVWTAKGGNILLYCGVMPTTLLHARTCVNQKKLGHAQAGGSIDTCNK